MSKAEKHVKTRDWALVRLLQGATKAGTHVDRRKEADRRACRKAKGSREARIHDSEKGS